MDAWNYLWPVFAIWLLVGLAFLAASPLRIA
jgi:hypothetical protein